MNDQNQLVAALREVFKDNSEDAPLLIKRVPFICADIKNINSKLDEQHEIMKEIKGSVASLDLKFVPKAEFSPIKLIVYGAVLMILIAVFGALLISVVPHATIAVP